MKLLLVIGLVCILYFLIVKAYKNTKDIAINKCTINSELSNGHHPKLKILQLSDMHLENISISPTELYEKLKDEHD